MTRHPSHLLLTVKDRSLSHTRPSDPSREVRPSALGGLWRGCPTRSILRYPGDRSQHKCSAREKLVRLLGITAVTAGRYISGHKDTSKNARVQRPGVFILTLPCHPLGTNLQWSLCICMEEPVQVPTAKGRPRANSGCRAQTTQVWRGASVFREVPLGGRFGKLHCVCDNSEGECIQRPGPADLGGLNSPTRWKPSGLGCQVVTLTFRSRNAPVPCNVVASSWKTLAGRIAGGGGGERNCSQVHAVP